MAQLPIVRRTEKLRDITALLKSRKAVYLSAFFYSGKTILIDQLCKSWEGKVLRFDPLRDDWDAFYRLVLQEKHVLIAIDSVDNPACTMIPDIAALIAGLSDNQYAILAGRGQTPSALYNLCSTGMITVLGKDFVMFNDEEIIQLFLEYGIELMPSDVRMILDWLWGWPFGLHILARKIQMDFVAVIIFLHVGLHQTAEVVGLSSPCAEREALFKIIKEIISENTGQ